MFSSFAKLKNTLNVQFLWILWTSLLIIGLLCSKFLITLSIIFAFVWALLARCQKTPMLSNWYKNPIFISLIGSYILLLLGSLWNANDVVELTTRLRVNLAYLFLPLAWVMLPAIKLDTIIIIIKIFITLLFIAIIGVFINYAFNYNAINEAISQSKAIPVPNKDHIRFSLLICLAIYCSIWLGLKLKHKIYYFLAVFFAVALHILAVRSGFLCFYASIFLIGGYCIFYYKKYKLGLMAITSGLFLTYIAYNHIPSLKRKVDLTIHNINLIESGITQDYSDTQRFLSYKIGWQVFKTSPIIGIGIGNIKQATENIYIEHYPNQRPMMPHNLYLTSLIGLGIVGCTIFIILSVYPLFFSTYHTLLIAAFYSIFLFSFLVENTIFVSLGSNMYVYFLLLFGNIAQLERKA